MLGMSVHLITKPAKSGDRQRGICLFHNLSLTSDIYGDECLWSAAHFMGLITLLRFIPRFVGLLRGQSKLV